MIYYIGMLSHHEFLLHSLQIDDGCCTDEIINVGKRLQAIRHRYSSYLAMQAVLDNHCHSYC